MRTPIEIIIEGENIIEQFTSDTANKVISALPEFIGKKITTADNTLTKKAANVLKPLITSLEKGKLGENYISKQCYFRSSDYTLYLHVRVCINGGSYDVQPNTAFTKYFERTVALGYLESTFLTELAEIDEPKKIDLPTELINVEKYKQLESELRELKYSINSEVREYFSIR